MTDDRMRVTCVQYLIECHNANFAHSLIRILTDDVGRAAGGSDSKIAAATTKVIKTSIDGVVIQVGFPDPILVDEAKMFQAMLRTLMESLEEVTEFFEPETTQEA